MTAGSVTADGDHRAQYIETTVPPTLVRDSEVALEVFPPGLVRLSTSMRADPDPGGSHVSGYVVIGSALYLARYKAGLTTEVQHADLTRIGGGWQSFVAVEQSVSSEDSPWRTTTYGLRSDGVLFRWTVDQNHVWRSKTGYPGFAAVKAMALISKTRTYDTFLATTRGGALYTIHIPVTSPMKPVVKLVRRSTWQGFESLIATGCGSYGTLLLGIDKATRTGYLYAVGHANGLSTVIQSRGKAPATFADPVDFRWFLPIDRLFGE
ncbi:hypothetical protein E0H50_29205 [Kribbella sindirgiensis]|uniref:Uncharacterized protein n=1 Tax=Kribbella sindirgiensis TaxID=1124744 RepID=A0A4R0I9T9_9ACTN|nr:hypothetical protein E0H50_29205 [Kribbella sindirgiensis]